LAWLKPLCNEYFGSIKDAVNGQYIPKVSVEILTPNGESTGLGFVANNIGSFSYDVNALAKLRLSSVGYATTVVPANYFAANGGGNTYSMQRALTDLPGVTVTFTKSKNNWLLYLIGAAVVTKILKVW